MKLRAITRSGFLTKTEEARKSGSLRKRASSFNASLIFVREIDLTVGELLFIKHVGGENKAGLFLDLHLHFVWINREARFHMPDSRIGRRLFFRASFLLIVPFLLVGTSQNEKAGFSF